MPRFLYGIFCDMERLSFSKQHLVISFQQNRQTANKIKNTSILQIFASAFDWRLKALIYRLRLDGILSFVLVTSYKI